MSAATAAPRSQPLEPGCTVAGRYLVHRVLGEGGMGQVLEVEHTALGRMFALKVLRLERWNDELVRRFNREARALARLSTPRVAQVTDFGVDPEVGPFYVMELLEGETLEDRIERDGPLAPLTALRVCAEVCDALGEVHAAGLVHRDLKPSNVGLARSGPVGVKLLDFGLAASTDDGFLSKITQSHQILGSLPYMAPEQFNGVEPVPAIDVYAVGVLLFEALTGRLPFVAPSTAALIHQILATPPPPLPADLPGRALLEPLLERLMAKEAHERFASATAAGHALREAASALDGRKASHPQTRMASEPEVPGTQARGHRMAEAIGYMPTLMAEASPTPLGPSSGGWAAPSAGMVESGTRLSAGSAAASTPSAHPPTLVSNSHLASAPFAQPTPSTASSPWPIWLLAVGLLGVVLAGAAGVGVVVVLSLLDGSRPAPASMGAPIRSRAAPPQSASVPVEPSHPSPMGEDPPASRATSAAADVPTVELEAAPADGHDRHDPLDISSPTDPSPASDTPLTVHPRAPDRRRPPPRVDVPPPALPRVYTPPAPPPRRSGDGTEPGSGIIRQW